MELSPFVNRLRGDLLAVAAGAGPDVVTAAERLAIALDPAVRMVLLEVVTEAAAAISAELGRETIDVRLVGRDPEFVVTQMVEPPTTTAPPLPPPPAPADAGEADDGGLARITVLLPEALKARAEEQAAHTGQSLNAWIVDAVRDGVDGIPGVAASVARRARVGTRVQGWVT